MGAISSINFKKSNAIQARHNDRDLAPNYLIGGNYECNHTHKEALALKNQIIKNSIEKYTEITGQKFQAKSYEWSAVVNIKPDTTMQDLEKLAEHFHKKYGFQCYQIAIHRDEGHINEQGQKEINHHAHLEFITLNKENGRNMWRRELITPKVLRQMQSEVAEILEMQRGQDKRITKIKRIEPRKYAQMKEAEKKEKKELKQELLSTKEVKERLEAERKAWILEKNHTAKEYKALRELTNRIYTDKTELEKEIKALKERLSDLDNENALLKAENQKLRQEIGLNEANIISYSPPFLDFKTKLISEVYHNIKHDFSDYYFDKEKKEFSNHKLDFKVQDNGNSITLNSNNNQNMSEKVSLMLKMAMAKDWDLNNLNIKGSNKFKAECYKQIAEIQKNKIKALESDLKAKEQKNNEIHQKENKNDLRGDSERLNAHNDNEYIIEALIRSLKNAYANTHFIDKNEIKIIPADNEEKKQTKIKNIQESLRAIKKAILDYGFSEKFTEWEKQNPYYKEVLEKYKAKAPIAKKQEQIKRQEQGRSL